MSWRHSHPVWFKWAIYDARCAVPAAPLPCHALLAALSLKKKWQEAREQAGKPISKPNLVMGAQGGWLLCSEGHTWGRIQSYFGSKHGTALPLNWDPTRAFKTSNLQHVFAVHVCWQKFCRYFDVEERYVPVAEGRYVSTPELMRPLIDENTIGGWLAVGSMRVPVVMKEGLVRRGQSFLFAPVGNSHHEIYL